MLCNMRYVITFLENGHVIAGPTAIIDQQYDAQQRKAVPDTPSRTALVFPNKNNYVLFDGRLGHGVLGSSSQQPRMTMLINWWAEKPQVLMLLSVTCHHACISAMHQCNLAICSTTLSISCAQS